MKKYLKTLLFCSVGLFFLNALQSCTERPQPQKPQQSEKERVRATLLRIPKWQELSSQDGENAKIEREAKRGYGYIFSEGNEGSMFLQRIERGTVVDSAKSEFRISDDGKKFLSKGTDGKTEESPIEVSDDLLVIRYTYTDKENRSSTLYTDKYIPWVGYPWPSDKKTGMEKETETETERVMNLFIDVQNWQQISEKEDNKDEISKLEDNVGIGFREDFADDEKLTCHWIQGGLGGNFNSNSVLLSDEGKTLTIRGIVHQDIVNTYKITKIDSEKLITEETTTQEGVSVKTVRTYVPWGSTKKS